MYLEENCAIRNMTSTQKTSLVCSWKAIKPNANSLMRKIFIELEAVAPKVKQVSLMHYNYFIFFIIA